MSEKRVKISNIVENQLPSFVKEEFPLVQDFLKQYYISFENQGQPLDILQNIDKNIKLENVTNLSEDLYLFSDISFIDNIIVLYSNENNFKGLPEKYGLIKIDNEIILYENKINSESNDQVELRNCIRGFNGISNIKDNGELVFLDSVAEEHSKDSLVTNLSILFLKEFLYKIKKQISPGFENRPLYSDLNEYTFLSRLKDFYSTKGTDTSFEILFRGLYGKNVDVIKPRDYLIKPSDAQYSVTSDLVVEIIEGDPNQLLNKTLYQDSIYNIEYSQGTIVDVQRIYRGDKDYYQISLDYSYNRNIEYSGTVYNKFKIHPKTKLLEIANKNQTYLDVDSTVGFPQSGILIINSPNGNKSIVSYKSKNLNQFLECTGIDQELLETSDVKLDVYAYAYSDDKKSKIQVRINGVLSDIEIKDSTLYFDKGDDCVIETFGKNINDFKYNNWIFNIPLTYDVKFITLKDETDRYLFYEISLYDEHNLIKNDLVTIISSDNKIVDSYVNDLNDKKSFSVILDKINESSKLSTNGQIFYRIRKRVSKLKVKNKSELSFNRTNVQNVYIDPYEDGSVYVTSSSLPTYSVELEPSEKSIVFSGKVDGYEITFKDVNGKLINHPFYTGDRIFYSFDTSQNLSRSTITVLDQVTKQNNSLGIKSGIYVIKRVNNSTIKLATSRDNIFNEDFVKLKGNVFNNRFQLFEFSNQVIDSQKLIRKISNTKDSSISYETLSGSTGIFVNGVELLNYKSKDKVFFGKINKINVLGGGDNYDVINPPIVTTDDILGRGCKSISSVKGSLQRIDIIDPGFDYKEVPKIQIYGGNGKEASAVAKLVSVENIIKFNASVGIDTSSNIINFFENHRFRNSEQIVYDSQGNSPIGGLVNGSSYFANIVGLTSVRLYSSLKDSISGINTISLSGIGTGNHIFRSRFNKKRIEKFVITNGGYDYEVKERQINNLGINTSKNSITIENHGYNSGEVIVYSFVGQSVSGLSTERKYYVQKINNDEFKLSLVAEESDNKPSKDFFYNTKEYVELTSSGIGTHIFKYEPITVTLDSGDPLYDAEIQPIFRGSIDSIFITDGGSNYGSSDILNYNRKPNIVLDSGSKAYVSPIIRDGKIIDVYILNPGENYNSVPDIIIEGDGEGAQLSPIITNKKLTGVKIISSGGGYTQKNTNIAIIPAGENAKFDPEIQSWTVNLVERSLIDNQIGNDDGIIDSGKNRKYGLQYTHAYAPRKLRETIFATKISDGEFKTVPDLVLNENKIEINYNAHSPIIGWAYDGNPIYGPYGYSSPRGGKIRSLISGYKINSNTDRNRPSVRNYPLGFFVEDYDFYNTGDLDEHNGRFCITPEFPNGIYAYFCTIKSSILDDYNNPDTQISLVDSDGLFKGYRKPIFPYVIGNTYKSTPIDFNFNYRSNQDDIDLNDKNFLRNTNPYNLNSQNSNYDYILNLNKIKKNFATIQSVNLGSLGSIEVISGGNNYKINDKINFDDELSTSTISAKVKLINGSTVKKISVERKELENIQLVPYNSFIAISTNPHGLKNKELISFVSKNEYKNTNGEIQIIQNNLNIVSELKPSDVTGIITDVKVSGDLDFPYTTVNSYYDNEDEKIKILEIDTKKSKIKIERNQNNTLGLNTSYIGSNIVEDPNKFIIDFGISTTTYNQNRNKQIYFEADKYVGLGTQYGVGITSTLFMDVSKFRSRVAIGTGSTTKLYFYDPKDYRRYKINDYVELVDSTNTSFNVSRKQVVSVGNTFISINFDSSTLSGIGVTSFVNRLDIVKVPTKTIRIPKHGLKPDTPIGYKPPTGGDPIGIGSTSIPGIGVTTLLPPISVCPLYPIPIDEDTIGIATKPNAPIDDGFFFTDPGSNDISQGQIHSFETIENNLLIGKIIRNVVTVSTASSHGLIVGDYVNLTCNPGITTTFKVKYDNYYKKLIINPIDFNEDNVDIFENKFVIRNHDFVNGQKVIHRSENPCEGLENNKIYYVIKLTDDSFRLTTTSYNAKNYYNPINISSKSYGTILPINPPLFVYQNSKIEFDLSDPSLSYNTNTGIRTTSAFDFDLYIDYSFNNKFYSSKTSNLFDVSYVGKVGIDTFAKVTVDLNDNTPKKLFYTLKTKKEILDDQYKIFNDTDIELGNQILYKSSKYNGIHRVVSTSSTSFTYNILEYPEVDSYEVPTSTISYTTNSVSADGPISEVEIINSGKYYNKMPGISSIRTISGNSSILKINSDNIGSIKKIKINDIGYDYPVDYTLRPTIKFPNILKINTLSTIKDIKVVSDGFGYLKSPKLIVLDSLSNEILDIDLDYDLKNKKVTILKNSYEINEVTPKILPINNSNGYPIKNITFDSLTKEITITLNVGFSTESAFPFFIGEEFLIENTLIGINTTGKGFNSKNYNYKLFKVKDFDSQIGGEEPTIVSDLSEFLGEGQFPGQFDTFNYSGKIIPKSYFPTFEVLFEKNKFFKGEIVRSNSSTGIVQSYDEKNGYLKVSTSEDFIPGEKIKALSSRTSALINDVKSSNAICNVNGLSVVERGWKTDTGTLNNNIQRMHDNDYYQYFSYALKSEVSFDKWKNPVESLNHTAGFKKFSDLIVESSHNAGIKTEQIYSEFSGTANLFEIVSLNCTYDFDLVRDKLDIFDSQIKSKGIIFNSRVLQDYIQSIGNRVLLVDDISPQFNDKPRLEKYSIIDTFRLNDIRSKKYFIYVTDKVIPISRQFIMVTLLHNDESIFLNQYGRVESEIDLGFFDSLIIGNEGNLLFYPTRNIANEYDVNFISYDILNNVTGIGSTDIGDIVKINSNSSLISLGTTSQTSILTIPSDYRSSKILLQISSEDEKYYEYNELTLLDKDSEIDLLEYGQYSTNSNSSSVLSGLGTYSVEYSGSDLILNFTPNKELESDYTFDYISISLSDYSSGFVNSGSESFRNGTIESSHINIPSSPTPGITTISSYFNQYGSSYYLISIEDVTNSKYKVSELILVNHNSDTFITEFGLLSSGEMGIFGSNLNGNEVELTFTAEPNIEVDIKIFRQSIGLTDIDSLEKDKLDLTNFTINSSFSDYVGVELDVKKSFDLKYKGRDIFKRTFNPEETINLNVGVSTNIIRLPENFFVTGEKVKYSTNFEKIGIAETFVSGIGLTNKLPDYVYIVKLNELDIQLSPTASDSLNFNPNVFEITSLGSGIKHEFISTNQDSKCLITIDNIIQSPIIDLSVSTELTENILFNEKLLKVSGVTSIFGGDLLRIGNEVVRVNSVGYGDTNTILVQRRWLGSGISTHSAGDPVIKVSGQYNIVDNTINFVSPPYGQYPLSSPNNKPEDRDYSGISYKSKFSGRVFIRSGIENSSFDAYFKNVIYDDISSEFNGFQNNFTLKNSQNNITGISTGKGIILINNVLQTPSKSNLSDDGDFYLEEESGLTSLSFTGVTSSVKYDPNVQSLPVGGIIISVNSFEGFGYQPLISAGGTAIVSYAGTIQSISIGNSGSGYRNNIQTQNGFKEVNVNVGVITSFDGDLIVENVGFASIVDGHVVDVQITNPGYGYTSTNPPIVVIDDPLSYSNLPLKYFGSSSGVGTEATIDIVVGQGSSIINFELKNLGYGYKKGDILTIESGGLSGIPTDTSKVFDEFQIIVDSVYTDSFSGWYFGDLIKIDDISFLFDGIQTEFPILIDENQTSIRSKPGSNIDIQSTLIILINGVIQEPGIGYIFKGGSIITFTEPPKENDQCLILFYSGTGEIDTKNVDILETIKEGDEVQIIGTNISTQNERVVDRINSTDDINTNIYFDKGIVTDKNILRPIIWCKQTEDKIINGKQVNKSRISYEPLVHPSTNIIKTIGVGDTEFFVENIKTLFDDEREYSIFDTSKKNNSIKIINQESLVSASATAIVDDNGSIASIVINDGGNGYVSSPSVMIQKPTGLEFGATASSIISIGGTVTSIDIVYSGIGYTQSNPPSVLIESPIPDVEIIKNVSYEGDYGIISGIGSTTFVYKPYDVSTIKYNNFLSVNNEESSTITCITFNNDGNILYVAGIGSTIHQYNLPIGWDLSNASFSGISTNIGNEIHKILFNDDGSKLFSIIGTSKTIEEYSLSTNWNISTISFVSSYPSLSGINGFTFNFDGTKLYTISDYIINEYDLSLSWDLSTTTLINSLEISSGALILQSISISENGQKLIIFDNSVTLNEYDLLVPYDISSISLSNNYVFLYESNPSLTGGLDFVINPDGSRIFTPTFDRYENNGNIIEEYKIGDFDSKALLLDLYIPSDSYIRNTNINSVGIATTGISGIQTGYYFVVSHSTLGCISGIKTSYRSYDGEVVGVGTEFIDNVYEVAKYQIVEKDIPGIGVTYINQVTVCVSDYDCINFDLDIDITFDSTSIKMDSTKYKFDSRIKDYYYANLGNYSWGKIITPNRKLSKEFNYYQNPSIPGITTSAVVQRLNPLKYNNYIT